MSLFGSLFSSKPKLVSPGFVNPITTELHSHLVPGIDDGVGSIDDSLEVLRQLAALGYKKVITTPHIMGDFYKNGPHNIIPGLETVRQAAQAEGIDIVLHAAAEYLVDDALESKVANKSILTFGDGYVLVELPFSEQPANLKQVLFELSVNGYKPVLAHPERYAHMAAHKERYEELFESGVLFQLNIFSLIGYYSPQIQKTAEWLIEKKMVSMIGSDIHGPRHIPVLKAALQSANYEKVCALPLLNNSL